MSPRLLPFGLLALGFLGGCGVADQGGYGDALAEGSAPFAIVDLQDGSVVFRTAIPDLLVNPLYRTTRMVFHRVAGTGSGAMLMAVFELTQAQWRQLAGTTPWRDVPDDICSHAADGDDHPAYNLDYLMVVGAIARHPLTAGLRFDLPSDDEWTAACGVASGWWWGPAASPEDLAAHAVVRESVISIDRLTAGGGMDTGGPLAVATTSANSLGFYDMQGNVWEWIKEGVHVRGGSWFDPAAASRAEVTAGADVGLDPEVDHALIGARLVLRP